MILLLAHTSLIIQSWLLITLLIDIIIIDYFIFIIDYMIFALLIAFFSWYCLFFAFDYLFSSIRCSIIWYCWWHYYWYWYWHWLLIDIFHLLLILFSFDWGHFVITIIDGRLILLFAIDDIDITFADMSLFHITLIFFITFIRYYYFRWYWLLRIWLIITGYDYDDSWLLIFDGDASHYILSQYYFISCHYRFDDIWCLVYWFIVIITD